MNAEPAAKKRRVSIARLDSIISQLKTTDASPRISNAVDILSIDSHELLRVCHTHRIPLTYQEVQSLKSQIAVSLLSRKVQPARHWSTLPDLLSPTTPTLPRQIFFGNPDLDALFPSLPHPALVELLEMKQDPGSAGDDPVPVRSSSHQVGMTLALASAARGAHVLLIDTGVGTEIGEGVIVRLSLDDVLHRTKSLF
jgi:hypothetical protein